MIFLLLHTGPAKQRVTYIRPVPNLFIYSLKFYSVSLFKLYWRFFKDIKFFISILRILINNIFIITSDSKLFYNFVFYNFTNNFQILFIFSS